ncbi:MAG: NADH-quinone oxidoreductase subunit M, partial [Acidimicrobiia bacterium]|nr:NADH-quinone oxidoreductase subunit M [Acidimicrobiia bacterium]
MAWFESVGLSLTVFLPAAGALALFALPKAQENAQKLLALVVTGLTAVLAVGVAANFDYGRSERFQFEVTESWIPAIGARYHIGV